MHTIQFLTLTLLTAGCFSAHGQGENPNFENWIQTDTMWNGDPIYAASQWPGGKRTADSYSGTYAAKVEPYTSCGIMPTYMFYGAVDPIHFDMWSMSSTTHDYTGSGAAVDFKPDQLSGYFKFLSPMADDVATGLVILKKFNAATGIYSEVGHGEIQFAPSTAYAPFTIQIADLQPNVIPDSIVIAFSSGMGYSWEPEDNTMNLGTLYIDQLRLKKGNGTAGLAENQLMKTSFYPNPATDVLHFSFETEASDAFTLVVTDASGKTVLRRDVQPGEITDIEMQHLTAGTYVASIQGKRGVYTTQTILKED
jgi:hypothetical protein